ncbi:MAG: twitch domain-containing radical SAM protein, partial [Bdellovibrionales bacterium]|nr:twitch domain-containing radical SAM protein [Bdellovibrionales bacterium]
KSLRELYNNTMPNLSPEKLISDIQSPEIKWLEVAISNDCNLICRMCDSRYSSKWFEEEKDFYGFTFSKNRKMKNDINVINSFLKDIVHIKFTGGEPLIIKDHFILLDRILKTKDASDIFLNYSTNLTIQPKPVLIEKWKKFKYIEIAASFDGIKETWEIVRYPSLWEAAERVIKSFFKLTHELDLRIGLRSTISVNNILCMGESFKWWIENWNKYASTPFNKQAWINPTHVTYPRFLSTTVLPKKYKDKVAEKLYKQSSEFSGKMKTSMEAQINHMFSEDNSQYLKELKDYTLYFDKKRNQNFFKVNPELKGLFDGVL